MSPNGYDKVNTRFYDLPHSCVNFFQVKVSGDNAMGEPTALSGGMEFGGTASGDATLGDVSSGDVPGVCQDDMDFKDIRIDIPSLPTDIDATSPLATNPWGGIDLEDI